MEQLNRIELRGHIGNIRIIPVGDTKVARFSVAHNFGRGIPALFTDCVIFPKKDEAIQEDLLKKGTPVLISGYLRPNANTKDGKTYTTTDFVVTSLLPAEVEDEGE